MKNKKWERDHGKPLEEEQKKEMQSKARQGKEGERVGLFYLLK